LGHSANLPRAGGRSKAPIAGSGPTDGPIGGVADSLVEAKVAARAACYEHPFSEGK